MPYLTRTMALRVAAMAAVAAGGCASPEPRPADPGRIVHDRPEPVTGSMLRRDRRDTRVQTVDPDAVRDGSRGSTAARPGSGMP